MGLELPKRARTLVFVVVGLFSLFLLGGCSSETAGQWKRVAMPIPATEEAPHTLHLWQWVWLTAMIVGCIVWGLIFYASFRFRRRSEDDVPVQTRYNLPIEMFYTMAPIIMVIVLFFFTVKTQNEVFHQFEHPDRTITVVGQQWSWTFNYNLSYNDNTDKFVPTGPVRYDVGTTAHRPTLWLVKGERTEFHLYSPDVIHSFWVPNFLFKLDVVPGRDNKFGVTPTRLGTFDGRCAELCGLYHSQMLFDVKVVTKDQFDAHLDQLAKEGNTGPALGGSFVRKQPGLEPTSAQNGAE